MANRVRALADSIVATLARHLATAAHAAVAEYRRLDEPPPVAADPKRTEINCTSAGTRDGWHPTYRAPMQARAAIDDTPAMPAAGLGFSLPTDDD